MTHLMRSCASFDASATHAWSSPSTMHVPPWQADKALKRTFLCNRTATQAGELAGTSNSTSLPGAVASLPGAVASVGSASTLGRPRAALAGIRDKNQGIHA